MDGRSLIKEKLPLWPTTFFEYQSSMVSPDTTTNEDLGEASPYLQICEEPSNKFRFRYETEVQGTHGTIVGVNLQKSKQKTFPAVKLCNYRPSCSSKDPVIRCSLYTADHDETQRSPHVHQLLRKEVYSDRRVTCKSTPSTLHDVTVQAPYYTAVFHNMTIFYTKRKDQLSSLIEKMKVHEMRRFTDQRANPLISTTAQMQSEAEAKIKSMDLNVVCLRFEALIDSGEGVYVSLCPPVYSKSICNMKSCRTNVLEICRSDKWMGCCNGGEEVFMFTSKVNKDNIRIRFYEETLHSSGFKWTQFAKFAPEDVHHQFGIVFKTPQYQNINITENVSVKVRLERKSNQNGNHGAVSEPKIFVFTPDYKRLKGCKRSRPSESDLTSQPEPETRFSPSLASVSPQIDQSLFIEERSIPGTNNTQLPLKVNESTNSITFPSADSDVIENYLIQNDQIGEVTQPSAGQLLSNVATRSLPVLAPDCCMEFDGAASQHSQRQNKNLLCNNLLLPEGKAAPDNNKNDRSVLLRRIGVVEGANKRPTERLREKLTLWATELRMKDNNTSIQGRNAANTQSAFASKITTNLEEIDDKVKDDAVVVNDELANQLAEVLPYGENLKKQTNLVHLFTSSQISNYKRILHGLVASNKPCLLSKMIKYLKRLKNTSTLSCIINAKNNNFETPLLVAVAQGSVDMVSALVEAGADVNTTDVRNNTALHLATLRAHSHLDLVKTLLRKQPDLTVCNEDGLSVLHLAVIEEKLDVISCLTHESKKWFPSGNLINLSDKKQGNTALHFAVHLRQKNAVKLLLNDPYVQVNCKNFSGQTPLSFVWKEKGFAAEEIKHILLKSNADPDLVKMKTSSSDEESESEMDSESDQESESEEFEISEIITNKDKEELSTSDRFALEWDTINNLFDKATLSSLCVVLDQRDNWSRLGRKFNYHTSEIEYCKTYWSPSLMLFKLAVMYKPNVTAESVRDHLATMSPELQSVSQLINRMLQRRQANANI